MRYNTDLLGYAVLSLTLRVNGQARGSDVPCRDIQGQLHESGFHYIPGPEPCTLCICDRGNPKSCKAVICTLPQESLPKQDCKSFSFGKTCCEFICMDDTLSSASNDKIDGIDGAINNEPSTYELGLRLVVTCITALLSVTLLFFIILRIRQRKIQDCVAGGRQSRQLTDEQRSLGSMGYLERGGLAHSGVPVGGMDDMLCGGGYPLWKPQSNYFPRGEAPPPYEEAVAAARAEQALLAINSHHNNSSLPPPPLAYTTTATSCLPPMHNSNSHSSSVAVLSSNAQNHVALMPGSSPTLLTTTTNCNAPAAAAAAIVTGNNNRPRSSPEIRCGNQLPQETTTGNNNTLYDNSASNNTYENLPVPLANATHQHFTSSCITSSNLLSVPNQSSHSMPSSTTTNANANAANNNNHHTTLPRQQSGAFMISSTLPSSAASHRTIPRTLTTSCSLRLRRELSPHHTVAPLADVIAPNVSPQLLPRSAPPSMPHRLSRADAFYEDVRLAPVQSEAKSKIQAGGAATRRDFKPLLKTNTESTNEGSFESCTCSMQAIPPIHDDADDYRSECENCKSATGSRYYLDNEDELVTSPRETMTLHRRPEEATSTATPHQYYRTSLTLPTSTRQRSRNTSSRGNWFSSMPESSTESSDDD